MTELCCPESDPHRVGAAEPPGVEKVTASELAGADVEQTPKIQLNVLLSNF